MAYVVVAKNAEKNQLVVGWDERATPGLYARECTVTSLSSVGEVLLPGDGPWRCEVQPRYRAQAEAAALEGDENRLKLHFDRPQRALTPGQICAFYEGGQLLGGGIFEEVRS